MNKYRYRKTSLPLPRDYRILYNLQSPR